jgi:hypothetical protein
VDILMAGRSDLKPIEIVVPIDSQSRTNTVLTTSSGTGSTGTGSTGTGGTRTGGTGTGGTRTGGTGN